MADLTGIVPTEDPNADLVKSIELENDLTEGSRMVGLGRADVTSTTPPAPEPAPEPAAHHNHHHHHTSTPKSIKKAFITRERLSVGDTVFVVAEYVRLNDERFISANHSGIVSFKEKYLHPDADDVEINNARLVFGSIFNPRGNFNMENPIPPCNPEEYTILQKGLHRRLQLLRREIKVLHKETDDSVMTRTAVEHAQNLIAIINKMDKNRRNDPNKCEKYDPDNIFVSMGIDGVNDKSIKDLYATFSYLVLQHLRKSQGHQQDHVRIDPTDFIKTLVQNQASRDGVLQYANDLIGKNSSDALPKQIKMILEMNPEDMIDENTKKFLDTLAEKLNITGSTIDEIIAGIQYKLDENKGCCDERDTANATIAAQNRELAGLKEQLAACNQKRKELEETQATLQPRVDALNAEIKQLQGQIGRDENNKGGLSDELADLKDKLRALLEEKQGVDSKLAKVSDLYENLLREHEALKEKCKNAAVEAEGAADQAAAAAAAGAASEASAAALQGRLDELQRELLKKENDLRESQEALGAAAATAATAAAAAAAAADELERLRRENATLKEENLAKTRAAEAAAAEAAAAHKLAEKAAEAAAAAQRKAEEEAAKAATAATEAKQALHDKIEAEQARGVAEQARGVAEKEKKAAEEAGLVAEKAKVEAIAKFDEAQHKLTEERMAAETARVTAAAAAAAAAVTAAAAAKAHEEEALAEQKAEFEKEAHRIKAEAAAEIKRQHEENQAALRAAQEKTAAAEEAAAREKAAAEKATGERDAALARIAELEAIIEELKRQLARIKEEAAAAEQIANTKLADLSGALANAVNEAQKGSAKAEADIANLTGEIQKLSKKKEQDAVTAAGKIADLEGKLRKAIGEHAAEVGKRKQAEKDCEKRVADLQRQLDKEKAKPPPYNPKIYEEPPSANNSGTAITGITNDSGSISGLSAKFTPDTSMFDSPSVEPEQVKTLSTNNRNTMDAFIREQLRKAKGGMFSSILGGTENIKDAHAILGKLYENANAQKKLSVFINFLGNFVKDANNELNRKEAGNYIIAIKTLLSKVNIRNLCSNIEKNPKRQVEFKQYFSTDCATGGSENSMKITLKRLEERIGEIRTVYTKTVKKLLKTLDEKGYLVKNIKKPHIQPDNLEETLENISADLEKGSLIKTIEALPPVCDATKDFPFISEKPKGTKAEQIKALMNNLKKESSELTTTYRRIRGMRKILKKPRRRANVYKDLLKNFPAH